MLAHKLAHIKNRDVLLACVAAAFAAAIAHLAHALSFSWLLGGSEDDTDQREPGGFSGFLAALVAPMAALLIQFSVSRSREYLADDAGARISGGPLDLAIALKKLASSAERVPARAMEPATASLFIVNPLARADRILQLFATHPPIEDRIRRLHETAMQFHRASA